jgi:hypothetical protein
LTGVEDFQSCCRCPGADSRSGSEFGADLAQKIRLVCASFEKEIRTFRGIELQRHARYRFYSAGVFLIIHCLFTITRTVSVSTTFGSLGL